MKIIPIKKNLILGWGMLALSLYGCGGQGSTIVGNPSNIRGSVSSDSSVPLSGTTVYIPANTSGSIITPTADCGANGGVVTCDAPPEASCAQTCSCSDGSFFLDVSGCSSTINQVNYCSGGSCQTTPVDCSTGICDIDLTFSQNPSLNVQNITGTYKPNFAVQNPCTTDVGDTDDIWITVNNGQVSQFEINDDATEKVLSLNGNVLTYTFSVFQNGGSPPPTASCTLTFNFDGTVDEVCSDTAIPASCNFAYTKCSDVYGQYCP